MFNQLNEFILSFNNRITRRVTKKAIVYKKDKCNNIISIRISNKKHIIIYTLIYIEEYDIMDKFKSLNIKSYAPLVRCTYINNNDELVYVKKVLLQYLKKALNIYE